VDGRPLSEIAKSEQEYPLARVLDTAERVGHAGEVPEFTRRLTDPNPAVRYWAAIGLRVAGRDAAAAKESLQKALTDPSEVVRAEILTALQDARLDDAIIKLVLPAAQDTSPLVRFRAAELLGASRKLRQEEVMNALAKDSDKFVAMMAGLFARTETAK